MKRSIGIYSVLTLCLSGMVFWSLACNQNQRKVEVLPRPAGTNTDTTPVFNPGGDIDPFGQQTDPDTSADPGTVPAGVPNSGPSGSSGTSSSTGVKTGTSTGTGVGQPLPGGSATPSPSPGPSPRPPTPGPSPAAQDLEVDIQDGGQCLKFNYQTGQCEVRG